MTDNKNPFDEYVQECLKLITICEVYELVESKKLEINARINPGTLRLLEELSKILDQTMPDLLTELITTGTHQLTKAYSENFGDKAHEVFDELIALANQKRDDSLQ